MAVAKLVARFGEGAAGRGAAVTSATLQQGKSLLAPNGFLEIS
jgi:hypothetical protein